MIFDYRNADLSNTDRSLCDYALKLTLTPGDVDRDDVETLRRSGLSDEAVTIATQVIGYFNYINRIADGLGVDPEDWMTLPAEEWRLHKTSSQGWLEALAPK